MSNANITSIHLFCLQFELPFDQCKEIPFPTNCISRQLILFRSVNFIERRNHIQGHTANRFVWRASQIYTFYIMLLSLALKLAISFSLVINGFSIQFAIYVCHFMSWNCQNQIVIKQSSEKAQSEAHNIYLLCHCCHGNVCIIHCKWVDDMNIWMVGQMDGNACAANFMQILQFYVLLAHFRRPFLPSQL